MKAWIELAALVMLVMADNTAVHVNGDCLACQVALWQWNLADEQGWDRLDMVCRWW